MIKTGIGNKMDKVNCGFNKWSIEIGENREVIVEFYHYPHEGKIRLHDASSKDLRNLGEMFLSAASEAEKG